MKFAHQVLATTPLPFVFGAVVLPLGLAVGHDIQLDDKQWAQLNVVYERRTPLSKTATAEDVRRAAHTLADMSAEVLDHIAQNQWKRTSSSDKARWLRSLAAALRHYRGWGAKLPDGAGVCALLAGGAVGASRAGVAEGVALAELARFIESDTMATVIDRLTAHWSRGSRVVGGYLACIASHMWLPLQERRRRWLTGVLRRLLRDKDAQVVAALADPIADSAVPGLEDLIVQRLDDKRPVTPTAPGILGCTADAVGESYRYAIQGVRPMAHHESNPALEVVVPPVGEWIVGRRSGDWFTPEGGWTLIVDRVARVTRGEPAAISTKMGVAKVEVPRVALTFEDEAPRMVYGLTVTFPEEATVNAGGDFPVGLVCSGSHTGSVGPVPSAYEWSYGIVAIPGRNAKEALFRIRIWRR